MRQRRVLSWLGGAAAATGIFFAGIFVARANPGGDVRRSLSFSGTLTGRTGPQMLTFTFAKGTTTACAPTVSVTPDATTGAFSTEIPLASCPVALFDGSDVTVAVSIDSTVISPAAPLNPVPYAIYAEHVGTPLCPTGYEPLADATLPTGAIGCRKGADDVVRVGSGPSAFWIDRYWNSLWSTADGSGAALTSPAMTTAGVFTGPTYALSRVGVATSGNFTYVQAIQLCAQSGKRLPSLNELILAVTGHPGLGTNLTPRPDECPNGHGLAYNAGSTPQCISRWGVEQMLGYRSQYTNEYLYAPAGSTGSVSYGETHGAASLISSSTGIYVGMQAIVRSTGSSSTTWASSDLSGLRCVIPR